MGILFQVRHLQVEHVVPRCSIYMAYLPTKRGSFGGFHVGKYTIHTLSICFFQIKGPRDPNPGAPGFLALGQAPSSRWFQRSHWGSRCDAGRLATARGALSKLGYVRDRRDPGRTIARLYFKKNLWCFFKVFFKVYVYVYIYILIYVYKYIYIYTYIFGGGVESGLKFFSLLFVYFFFGGGEWLICFFWGWGGGIFRTEPEFLFWRRGWFFGKGWEGMPTKWCVFFTCEWLAGDFPYEMVRYI